MKNPNNLWTKYVNVFRQAILNRQILNADQYRPEESQFLSSSLSIQETPLSPLPRITLWAISLLTIFAVLWSIFGEIDVIVSGSGSVKDMKIGTQNIQALDTVVVKKILVHEGDIVKKGQTLIELDINIPKAELDKNMQDVSNMYHEKIKKQIIIDSINNNLSEEQINNKIKNSVLKKKIQMKYNK